MTVFYDVYKYSRMYDLTQLPEVDRVESRTVICMQWMLYWHSINMLQYKDTYEFAENR